MLTKNQALTAGEFHHGDCTRTVGPRGGITIHSEVWRRNGRTQTWVTRPDEYRVPVKFGMWDYSSIREYDAHMWHAADECPLHDHA